MKTKSNPDQFGFMLLLSGITMLVGVIVDTAVTYTAFKFLGGAQFFALESNKDFAMFLVENTLSVGLMLQFVLVALEFLLPVIAYGYYLRDKKDDFRAKILILSIVVQTIFGAMRLFGGLTWLI